MVHADEIHDCVVDQLVKRTAMFYDDTEYSDLLIKCGARHFHVHEAIVCAGCDFFHAACKSRSGGGFKEGAEGVVTLKTEAEGGFDDPDIIARAIEYLYKTDYCLTSGDDHSLATHAKVFATAEQYGIKALKEVAAYKFEHHMASSSISLLDLAEAIRIVFTTTAEEVNQLRGVLKEFLVEAETRVTDDAEVRSAVEAIPRLPFELFKKIKGIAQAGFEEHVSVCSSEEDMGFGLFD